MDIVSSDWINPVFGIPLPDNWKVTSRKKLNKLRNRSTWRNVFMSLMRTALDRYYIDGLPDTCEQRVALMSLLWYGRMVVFEQAGAIYMLPCVNSSDGFTVYGEWRSCRYMALNGMSEEINLVIPGSTDFLQKTVIGGKARPDQRGVLIRENRAMYPFITYVMQYADYMTDTLRTLDTARRHLKHPTVIVSPQSAVKTSAGQELAIDDNQDVILVPTMTDPTQITTLNLSVTGITNEVRELYEWYEAQFLGLCGIAHNSGSDKKGENLLTAEIGIDSESDNTNLNSCMDSIQEGLDLANEVFGLNMKVKTKHKQQEKIDLGGENDDLSVPGANEENE